MCTGLSGQVWAEATPQTKLSANTTLPIPILFMAGNLVSRRARSQRRVLLRRLRRALVAERQHLVALLLVDAAALALDLRARLDGELVVEDVALDLGRRG